MADRRAEYRFRNGTVWDRLLFSITEPCIISGWTQQASTPNNNTFYRKFPGGYIVQGSEMIVTSDVNSHVDRTITLPIAYQSYGPVFVWAYLWENDRFVNDFLLCHCFRLSNSQIRIVNANTLNPNRNYHLHWIGFGF